MCGRFTLTRPPKDVAAHFRLDDIPVLHPRFNVAPTQSVFAVRAGNDGACEGALLRWGLVPSWAADLSIGVKLLNARAETVAEKPSFRAAFVRRRCLVAADGFYEWQAGGKKKQPIHFRFGDGRLFAFAGLWERWTSREGEAVETCTILTTVANELVKPIHQRMPVILDPGRYAGWLDAGNGDTKTVSSWLAPWPADEMTATPVSEFVNNARNDGPDCLTGQGRWFRDAPEFAG